MNEEEETKIGEDKTKSHHVVWADRIGLNKLWAKDIERIRIAYGTDEIEDAVKGLYYDLVNIRKGPQLTTIAREYWEGEWTDEINKELAQWREEHPHDAHDQTEVEHQRRRIEKKYYPILGQFMKQLLEDHGFAFYKSEYDGEYEEM